MLPLFITNGVDSLIMYATYFIWLAPEFISSFTDKARPGSKVSDRSSGFFLIASIWLGIYSAYWTAFSYPPFAIPFHRTALFAAGIFLMLAGVAFRWYSIRVLGKYFTRQVTIQPGQTVVEAGPYRWIRHPSYSGALLTILGVGVAFSNWLSLVCIVLITAIGYGYRIHVEEMTLVSALGEPYREYMKRTKRIIPFII